MDIIDFGNKMIMNPFKQGGVSENFQKGADSIWETLK